MNCVEKLTSLERLAKPEKKNEGKDIDKKVDEWKEYCKDNPGKCYWCNNTGMANTNTKEFCSESDRILQDHPQCLSCTRVIFNEFNSENLKRLLFLKAKKESELSSLRNSEQKARESKAKLAGQKFQDVLGGSIWGNSDTQFAYNSADQSIDSFLRQIENVQVQLFEIKDQIKTERVILAKKFFLKDDLEINKTKEKNTPLELLKIRLAKGEISPDEFSKMKKLLEE
tara:strand:- start:1281 stop:1961 length:681 start_codon:yes stop_codon:yes gene_type:complete